MDGHWLLSVPYSALLLPWWVDQLVFLRNWFLAREFGGGVPGMPQGTEGAFFFKNTQKFNVFRTIFAPGGWSDWTFHLVLDWGVYNGNPVMTVDACHQPIRHEQRRRVAFHPIMLWPRCILFFVPHLVPRQSPSDFQFHWYHILFRDVCFGTPPLNTNPAKTPLDILASSPNINPPSRKVPMGAPAV